MSTHQNRALYDRGRGISQEVARRVNAGADLKAALVFLAEQAGKGVKETLTAYDFYTHVEQVEGVVPGSRRLILSGQNPHLTPSWLVKFRKKSHAAIATGIDRAAAGLHPSAPPPPTDLPTDLVPWHYHLDHLQQATEELTAVESTLARFPHPLSAEATADLAVHTLAMRVAAAALRTLLPRQPSVRFRPSRTATPCTPGELVRRTGKVRRGVDEVAGELPRAAHARPPSPVAAAELARAVGAVADLIRRVERLLRPVTPTPTPPTVRLLPGGPAATGGTYLIVFHAPAASVLRLARLGTFRLPAGPLVYVGGAFKPGGVLDRTNRHVTGTGPRLWQVDDLRGFAIPVARWWTHHPSPLEHTWARAVAGLPGCLGVAPRGGGSDCHRVGDRRICPAHLYSFAEPPTPRAFARRLGLAGSGGYEIGVQELTATEPAKG